MILFDLTATQPLGNATRHGGGKYGEIVLRRILERGLGMSCFFDSKKWLNPETLELLQQHQVTCYDIQKQSLDSIVEDSHATCIYSALPQRQLFTYTKCPIIGTVHGLRRLETPADNYCFLYRNQNWQTWLAYLLQSFMPNIYTKLLCRYKLQEWANPNVRFVTVSNHSANAIKVYFPSFKDKEIPVFYSPSTSTTSRVSRKYTQKYFLLVSANRLEKNNLRAIMALDKLFSNGYLEDYCVMITGATDASNYRYRIKNKEKFHFHGYVEEVELEQLYHDAYALIYPSVNEGFGYPPLESMHYGVPVLASPFTSIPEVCEGAAIYYNPFSIDEIAARILYITDEAVHDEYAQRSIKQFEKITHKQYSDLDALIDYIYQ